MSESVKGLIGIVGNNTQETILEQGVDRVTLRFSDGSSWTNMYTKLQEFIYSFEEIVPEKVVVVYFTDGQSEKMVCREPDVFDLHRCLYLAIAKHLYKQEYTTEGIEYKASELSMKKKYVKIVENAIKVHNRMLRDQEKAERLELERIAAKNRRLQKKQEKRAQTKEVKLEEAIEMHKEAYLRAMKEYKNDKKKEK